MARRPVNALVLPYRERDGRYEFAIFNRADSDADFWQGISGGVEDDETPLQAAVRESAEEGGIPADASFTSLDTISSIPADNFRGHGWGPDVYVVHEHTFAVDVTGREITLSDEHTEYRWLPYDDAVRLLKHRSNRVALGELNRRLGAGNKTGSEGT